MRTQCSSRSRREILGAFGVVAASSLLPHTVAAQSGRTFVLVHGAWHGGWCWRRVTDRLQAAGHTVYTPTLTGLGERSHLLSREITLDTHITDVILINAF